MLRKLRGLGSGESRWRDPRRAHRSRIAVTCEQGRDGRGTATDGEQSDEGIVVNKPVGKAAMAGELAQHVASASPDSKGGDLMRSPEPWKKSNERQVKSCVQTGAGEPGSAKNRGRTIG
jgi:hypothetical protein